MAALPSNNTAVLFLDYSCCGRSHTVQARYSDTSSATDAMTMLDNFLSAVGSSLFLVTIDGARVRNKGQNVTYPVTWTGATSYGSGAGIVGKTAWYLHFVGRSIGGRRNRITLFGNQVIVDPADDNYRISVSNATVAAGLAALEADPGTPCAIDGDTTNWHQYANLGANAYWVKQVR